MKRATADAIATDTPSGPGASEHLNNQRLSGDLAAKGFLAQIDSDLDIAELTHHGRFSWELNTRELHELSRRELEVFLLLGFGLSNRSIAHVLGVTERTVKAHVGRVLSKLALESRLQAGLAAFALLTAGDVNVRLVGIASSRGPAAAGHASVHDSAPAATAAHS